MSQAQNPSVNTVYAYALREAVPLSALFELTYRCNLHCSHCYVADGGGVDLSFSEIAGILQQLAAEGCLFLTFTGGEVMVRHDFLDIARYARGLGFALKVFTNGTLLTENIAQEMAGLKPLQVGISVYGADAATHDDITGVPGSFERSISALRRLHAQGIMTMLKCVLMKSNFAQMNRIRDLAHEVGAMPQFDPVVTPRNDGNRTPLQHELDEDALYQLFSTEAVDPKNIAGVMDTSQCTICRAGRDICCVSPVGEVRPCVAMPMVLGSLRQHSFAEIWRGAEAQKLRNLMLRDLRQCVSCPDLNYCIRCWGLAGLESGDYLGPSHLNCRIARIRHRISAELVRARKEVKDEAKIRITTDH